MEVQQHPDGYEEKAGKDIPKRKNMGESFMTVFGFGDDQTGKEGAQCQREPDFVS